MRGCETGFGRGDSIFFKCARGVWEGKKPASSDHDQQRHQAARTRHGEGRRRSPYWAAGPAAAVPTAAPTPKAVTSHEKASVTVPAGACRSTTTKAQASDGARNRPDSPARAVIAATPGTRASGR